MGTKNWLGGVGISVLLLACSDGSGSSFEVGDFVDGGRVTDVQGGVCQVVTIEHDPAWSCSAEQLELVQGSSTPYPQPGGATAPYPQPGDAGAVDLLPTDCEGLAALRRPALKLKQQQTLDSNQRALLANHCVATRSIKYYQNGDEVSYCSPYSGNNRNDGSPSSSGPYASGSAGSAASAPQPGLAPSDPQIEDSNEGASEYSTTNTQVIGVDEADFVKNDAEHVYVLSTAGLHVIDAWPAAETKEVKLLPLPGEPRRMFLEGDQLVVYTRINGPTNPYGYEDAAVPSAQGCTYGYDCRFSAEPGQTLIVVFDVSDPGNPQALRSFAFSGNYVASRRVGQYVYTVVQDGDMASLPGVDLSLDAQSADDLEAQYQDRREEADAAIDTAPAADFLPWVHGTDEAGAERNIEACDNALAAQAAQGQSFVSLVSFDLQTLANPTRTLVAGKPGYVYASGSALYLATDGVDGGDFIQPYQSAATDRSTIHKFALDGVSTSYRGSSAIPGHVLNQFSMDELDGVLRVATSSGRVPASDVSSNLLTLSEESGVFQQLGHIGGIAPTEDIRSVRFDGTRAFVVTFKKTDPLFVFDLTVPATPRILGELKIPGFSTYMHPMDQNHLLAIGFDADDQGSFAYFDGIQIQIFDVTELSNPLLMHKTTIGTRGSASEALTNHLAFNYFPSKGVLALPMTVCEGGDNGVYGDQLTFSGLMVFDVSLQTGIVEHGRMPFVDTAQVTSASGSNFSCGNWWTQSTSDVKRSIFMDDYAIGISDTAYKVAPLANLSSVMQTVALGAQ